jgi:hypothetical protein
MAKKTVIINKDEFNPIILNEVDQNSSLFDQSSSSDSNSLNQNQDDIDEKEGNSDERGDMFETPDKRKKPVKK